MTTLHIRQDPLKDAHYPIRLTLKRPGRADQEAEANIEFALTNQEQEDLRWYLEEYLQHADSVEPLVAQQVEEMMMTRGEELYTKILAGNTDTQAIWFSIRNELANIRVEIAAGIAEAASIPWELMRDPKMDSPISLRVKSFVRIQSNPNISFVNVPPSNDGRVRLLYIACRPSGTQDVELRAVANRLLQDLGENRVRFDIKALRPPTFERLQEELTDAKEAGRPYHIVHFDGHGIYANLNETTLAAWISASSHLTLDEANSGKHGYLLFEHPSEDKMRPVDGQTLGLLLHDSEVPILVLNACQSAMHEARVPRVRDDVHDEVRAIGSLAQAVIDQGIPAVLGMRYSVYVVTAAQYIGQLYAALAKGRSFGQAATEGRKHLQRNPDRWIGLHPRSLHDWFVPVAHEAGSIELVTAGQLLPLGEQREMDPVQLNRTLLRYVPEEGFIGRDETVLTLDRAFDTHRVVLLHAYAGQGKTSTAVEFARWYATTGGLAQSPLVLLASFESHADLNDLLNQIGHAFSEILAAQNIHWSAINDESKRQQLVLQLLRLFPILWIWDNIEPVAGFPEGTESHWTEAEQNELRNFLKQVQLDRASKVKILLTSRRDEKKWLGAIPHRIEMPRMRRGDAAKLALKLGEEKNLKPSEIADWQPLLDYCAGNPLTLRVLIRQAVSMGLRGSNQITRFVEDIRGGEEQIKDADEKQGRDKSLGASLDYGFRHAFKDDELPIVALLHLFQGTVDVDALSLMGDGEHALPELKGNDKVQLLGLLKRARDAGLLTHLGETWFTIHPALPWFLRQLFARHYDGQAGRSSSQAAIRAWVEAVSGLGGYYHGEFFEGKTHIVGVLELEEANFVLARHLARRNRWWRPVIGCMQALSTLYGYQGRKAEWARLVEEVVPDYCDDDDEPIEGRDGLYTVVMGYRVQLARVHDRDVAKATALQEKLVALHRSEAASILALSADAPLDDKQKYRLHSLAVSVFTLGQILRGQGNAESIHHFMETINLFRRIESKRGEAQAELNLGHVYLMVPAVLDLDAAEAAYQRAFVLEAPNDNLNRATCIKQIGMVHHERFLDSRKRNEPIETQFRHLQAAENHYLEGLRLCPKDALTDLAPMHAQVANLYQKVNEIDEAREHYERAALLFEKVDDHFQAGAVRFNIAFMYSEAAETEDQPSQQRANLQRARAYAESALRDFQHYQGRLAPDEAKAQDLVDRIDRLLARPSE